MFDIIAWFVLPFAACVALRFILLWAATQRPACVIQVSPHAVSMRVASAVDAAANDNT